MPIELRRSGFDRRHFIASLADDRGKRKLGRIQKSRLNGRWYAESSGGSVVDGNYPNLASALGALVADRLAVAVEKVAAAQVTVDRITSAADDVRCRGSVGETIDCSEMERAQ